MSEDSSIELADLVDLDRYPIDQPDSAGYRAAVEQARVDLGSVGCAVVKDLVRPEALERLGTEIWERKGATHFSTR